MSALGKNLDRSGAKLGIPSRNRFETASATKRTKRHERIVRVVEDIRQNVARFEKADLQASRALAPLMLQLVSVTPPSAGPSPLA